MSTTKEPRCIHGNIWSECLPCKHMAWCEDCGDWIEHDEPVRPQDTFTCSKCVDRMIAPPAPVALNDLDAQRFKRTSRNPPPPNAKLRSLFK